jgi:hypothetical protein
LSGFSGFTGVAGTVLYVAIASVHDASRVPQTIGLTIA